MINLLLLTLCTLLCECCSQSQQMPRIPLQQPQPQSLPDDPSRPSYHYTRPYGWQNDPVPFRASDGIFHLFPLCDPNATTQWTLPSDHNAWCHASSLDLYSQWTTHKPALMQGPWPGTDGVGGTGNVFAIPSAEQEQLNATTAIVTGGAWLWLSSDQQLLNWRSVGGLLNAGAAGAAAPKTPPGLQNVTSCGDVHVYFTGSVWRIIMAGGSLPNGCEDSSDSRITPLALVYEAPKLQLGGWKFKKVLYVGRPGDGPRLECPTYFTLNGTSVLLFSKTGAPGFDTHGTYWATGFENTSGKLQILQEGKQQVGGYANGAFEASSGRWIVFSWLDDLSGSINCRNSLNKTLPGCWKNAQSLPREVALQPDGKLFFPVAQEILKLVGSESTTNYTLVAPNTSRHNQSAGAAITPQSRTRVSVSLTSGWGTFGVDLMPHEGSCIRVQLASTLNSTTMIQLLPQFKPGSSSQVFELPLYGNSRTAFDFEVWIDRSIVEVYADGGAAVLTGVTGLQTEPNPVPVSVWASVVQLANVSIAVAPVKPTTFTSDPGPWNPLAQSEPNLPTDLIYTPILQSTSICINRNVYVDAQAGHDNNTGCTGTNPVKSIERAMSLLSSGSRVHLSGVFRQRKPIVFDGSADNTEWIGSTGTVVSGGLQVRADLWAPATAAAKAMLINQSAAATLLQLDLTVPDLALNSDDIGMLSRHGFSLGASPTPLEVFINGTRMLRSRWPKKQDSLSAIRRIHNPNKSHPIFDVNSTRPNLWNASRKSSEGVWIDGILGQNWVWTYNKVDFLSNGSLSLSYPEVDNIQLFSPTYCCHNRFFFDNVFEELSEPGEYYINGTTLYMIPVENWRASEVILSVVSAPLVTFTASNVSLRNVIVSVSRGGGIHAVGASHITLSNLKITNMGMYGVELGYFSSIESSEVSYVGSSGISVTSGDTDRLIPGSSSVYNCHVHNWAYWNKVYTGGINIGGVGNTISHCSVHAGPHGGIFLYGNDHLIEYTEVSYIARDFVDMGAIYINLGLHPLQRGTSIERNFFHHLGTPTMDLVNGVYPDSSTMGLTVSQNVFYSIQNGAIFGNGYSYINTTNNIFVDCKIPFELNDWLLESWGSSNYPIYLAAWKKAFSDANASGILPLFEKKYPELKSFFQEDRRAPKSDHFSSSIIYNPTLDRKYGNASSYGYECGSCNLSDVQSANIWLPEENPGFANISSMNFSLQAEKVPFPWESIPFDSIGLINPVGPATVASTSDRID